MTLAACVALLLLHFCATVSYRNAGCVACAAGWTLLLCCTFAASLACCSVRRRWHGLPRLAGWLACGRLGRRCGQLGAAARCRARARGSQLLKGSTLLGVFAVDALEVVDGDYVWQPIKMRLPMALRWMSAWLRSLVAAVLCSGRGHVGENVGGFVAGDPARGVALPDLSALRTPVFVVCELAAASWAFPGVGCRVFGPTLMSLGLCSQSSSTHP